MAGFAIRVAAIDEESGIFGCGAVIADAGDWCERGDLQPGEHSAVAATADCASRAGGGCASSK